MNNKYQKILTVLGTVGLYSTQSNAADVLWGPWNYVINVTGNDSYSYGRGSATPNTIKALAGTSTSLNPLTWTDKNVNTNVKLTNTFTIIPGVNQIEGQVVEANINGHLSGRLYAATANNISGLTGTYYSSVFASVNAGFASWSNPISGYSISGNGYSINNYQNIDNRIEYRDGIKGPVVIGQTYNFLMELIVNAQSTGVHQSGAAFDDSYIYGGEFYASVAISD
jgi:hypothetical protein